MTALLAPSQDGEASPQARDERGTVVGREGHTEEPSYDDVTDWVECYESNPLVRVPVQNFASDVTEPGIAVAVDAGDDSMPTVPEDYPDDTYAGMDLDDALEAWLEDCYIDGWDFDADVVDLLDAVVKDRRGRRGTAIVEHAYDDPRERQRVLGLRPIKVETVTAYTRSGKGIVLRPDDDVGEFESVAVQDLSDSREEAPKTPADKTAALAQYDDVFGGSERDEIPFALDDISVSAYDPDTGSLFGQPDTATIVDRAEAVREKLERVDQAVLNAAFSNIIAQVDSQEEEVVKKVRDNLDPNDPEIVSATNAPVNLTEVSGQVPDAVDTIQQEIEFVLAAMPTPLYRVGFAGDINRDITSEQQDDYTDALRRERRRLEADFQKVLRLKATEFLKGDAHADSSIDVDVGMEIRPDDATSPLQDDEFDAGEFSTLMDGLSTAAGPKGGADAIVPKRVILETFLDMDPDEILDEDGNAELAALDESDPRVRDAFERAMGAGGMPAELAEGEENHVFGPAMNTGDGFYRLDPEEAYCEHEGEVFEQFDGADTDDLGRRLCPYCGEQLQDYDKAYHAALAGGGVRFTNVGGDPFGDEDVLTAFLEDVDEAADGPVMLGDTEWPADDYSIHDRPVTAVGLSEADARAIWSEYADDAVGLMGPKEAAELANQYAPGKSIVDTPDGKGLVVEVITESKTIDEDADGVPDEIEASSDSPTYAVTLGETSGSPVGFFKTSDLEATEIDADVDPTKSLDEEEAAAIANGECPTGEDATLAGGRWSPPDSWEKANTPARLIALDAFQSMGGDFEGCEREMRGSVRTPQQFCGAFIDYVFGGYDYWRGDSFLPGD